MVPTKSGPWGFQFLFILTGTFLPSSLSFLIAQQWRLFTQLWPGFEPLCPGDRKEQCGHGPKLPLFILNGSWQTGWVHGQVSFFCMVLSGPITVTRKTVITANWRHLLRPVVIPFLCSGYPSKSVKRICYVSQSPEMYQCWAALHSKRGCSDWSPFWSLGLQCSLSWQKREFSLLASQAPELLCTLHCMQPWPRWATCF